MKSIILILTFAILVSCVNKSEEPKSNGKIPVEDSNFDLTKSENLDKKVELDYASNPLIGKWKLVNITNLTSENKKEINIHKKMEFTKDLKFFFTSDTSKLNGNYEYLTMQVLLKDIYENGKKSINDQIINFSHLDSLSLIIECRQEKRIEYTEYELIKASR